jgi:hypothetical protein
VGASPNFTINVLARFIFIRRMHLERARAPGHRCARNRGCLNARGRPEKHDFKDLKSSAGGHLGAGLLSGAQAPFLGRLGCSKLYRHVKGYHKTASCTGFSPIYRFGAARGPVVQDGDFKVGCGPDPWVAPCRAPEWAGGRRLLDVSHMPRLPPWGRLISPLPAHNAPGSIFSGSWPCPHPPRRK